VRQFRWVVMGLLGFFLVLSTLFSEAPQTMGASAEWVNGRYRFSGGTQPWALGLAASFVAVFVLLMGARCAESQAPLPGLTRRFAAFWLDFLFAMFTLTPLIGVVPMIVEWRRTGTFAWSFERTIQAPSDIPVTVLSFLLLIPGLLVYFAIPMVLRRPSPGASVAGYQVVADDGRAISLRLALLRSIVGYFALCAGFIAPFVGRDKNLGKFWLDKVFHTRAVLLK